MKLSRESRSKTVRRHTTGRNVAQSVKKNGQRKKKEKEEEKEEEEVEEEGNSDSYRTSENNSD